MTIKPTGDVPPEFKEDQAPRFPSDPDAEIRQLTLQLRHSLAMPGAAFAFRRPVMSAVPNVFERAAGAAQPAIAANADKRTEEIERQRSSSRGLSGERHFQYPERRFVSRRLLLPQASEAKPSSTGRAGWESTPEFASPLSPTGQMSGLPRSNSSAVLPPDSLLSPKSKRPDGQGESPAKKMKSPEESDED